MAGVCVAVLAVSFLAATAAAQAPVGKSVRDREREREKNILLTRGQSHEYFGDHDEAIALYRKATARMPGDLGTALLLSGLQRRLGRVQQARQTWDRWMKHSPRADRLRVASSNLLVPLLRAGKPALADAVCEVWLQRLQARDRFAVLGDTYWRRGNHTRAIQLYTRHLALVPGSKSVLRRVVSWHLKAGLGRAAVAALRLYLGRAPADLEVTRRLVGLLAQQKRTGEVQQAWRRWLAASRMARRHAVVGDYFRKAGDQALAVHHYARHLELHPTDMKVLRYLARVLDLAGRRHQVVKLYGRAAEATTKTKIVQQATEALWRLGQIETAQRAWSRWISRSTEADRLKIVARFYLWAGKPEQAEPLLLGHLVGKPADMEAVRLLAGRYLTRGRPREANKLWDKYCRRSKDRDRFENAGDYFKQRNRPPEAMAYYRRHLVSQPDDTWVVRTLAKLFLQAGNNSAAAKIWHRYLAKSSDNDRFGEAASYFLEARQSERAVALFRRHLQLNPQSLQAQGELAEALRQAGKAGLASALWEKVARVSTNKDRFKEAANFFQKLGKGDRAIAMRRKHFQLNPDRWACTALAGALCDAGKPGEAVRLWEQAVKTMPDRARFAAAGDFFSSMGKLDRAVAMYRRHLTIHPVSLSAHGALAKALHKAGKIKQAMALWEKAVRTLTDKERFGKAGDFFKSLGRPERAGSLYRRRLSLNTRDLAAYRDLAKMLVLGGKTKQAMVLWERAVRSVGDKDRFYHAGGFYKDIGRWDRAVTSYRQHLVLNPTCLQAHASLAEVLRGSGKVKLASTLWEKAARSLNDDYRFFRAGYFFAETGRLDRATAMYRKHLALKPGDISAHRLLAGVLLSAGEIKQAVALWEKAVRALTDKNRYGGAGDFFSSIGRPGRALAMYRKHLALNPADRGAYDQLADQLVDMGKPAEAVAVWDAGLKASRDPYRYVRAGRLHQQLGDLDRAVALKRQFLRVKPREVAAYGYLADALVAAGKTAEAERVWQLGVQTGTAYRFSSAANFFRRIGKLDRALPLYRRHLALNPASCHAYRDLARALHAAGKAQEAGGVWERGTKRCREVYGKEFAANHYRDTGQIHKAVALYRAYLRTRPMDRTALSSLAQALLLAGQTREAEATLLRAAQGQGLQFRYLTVGRFYGQLGRWDEAIARFRQLVATAPGESSGYRYLAGAYLATGKRKLAEAVWKQGLRQCTGQYCVAHAADFYQTIGRCEVAFPLYRKVIAAGNSRNIQLRSHLARCLGKRGQAGEALRHLDVTSTLVRNRERMAPSDNFSFNGEVHLQATVLNSAAWFYLVHEGNRKRWKHALALARRAATLLPADANILGTQVIALYRNGRAAEALPVVHRRLALGTGSAWGHLEAALVYMRLGKKTLARQYLAKSRKMRSVPDTEMGQFEKELTAGLGGPPVR